MAAACTPGRGDCIGRAIYHQHELNGAGGGFYATLQWRITIQSLAVTSPVIAGWTVNHDTAVVTEVNSSAIVQSIGAD